MELVELLLGGGLLLSNERKNQTKVDQLIHQDRSWAFYCFGLRSSQLIIDLYVKSLPSPIFQSEAPPEMSIIPNTIA